MLRRNHSASRRRTTNTWIRSAARIRSTRWRDSPTGRWKVGGSRRPIRAAS